MNRGGNVIYSQETYSGGFDICVPQHHPLHTAVKNEWKDVQNLNSHCDAFVWLDHVFNLILMKILSFVERGG